MNLIQNRKNANVSEKDTQKTRRLVTSITCEFCKLKHLGEILQSKTIGIVYCMVWLKCTSHITILWEIKHLDISHNVVYLSICAICYEELFEQKILNREDAKPIASKDEIV